MFESMILNLIFLAVSFCATPLTPPQSSLPSPDFILSRTVNKASDSGWKVSSRLVFAGEPQLTLDENFVADASGNISIQVSAKDQVILKKIFPANKSVESLFLAKSREDLIRTLKFFQIPTDTVRLGRIDGVVAWVFGLPDSPKSFWVEQDQFIPLKLRVQNDSEIRASGFAAFKKGFTLPRKKVYTFSGDVVTQEVKSVVSLDAKTASRSMDSGSNLIYSNFSDARVQNFIERFR